MDETDENKMKNIHHQLKNLSKMILNLKQQLNDTFQVFVNQDSSLVEDVEKIPDSLTSLFSKFNHICFNIDKILAKA